MSMKLFVCNLASQTSSADLGRLFAQAGMVELASVIANHYTGRSRGFGFVEMSSRAEGKAAIAQFNGKEVGGRALTVNEAKPPTNRAAAASNNGRGGFGGNRSRR